MANRGYSPQPSGQPGGMVPMNPGMTGGMPPRPGMMQHGPPGSSPRGYPPQPFQQGPPRPGYPGARMPMGPQGGGMPPPGAGQPGAPGSYPGTPMGNRMMGPTESGGTGGRSKRPIGGQQQSQGQPGEGGRVMGGGGRGMMMLGQQPPGGQQQGHPPKKKKKLADKILPQRVRDLVPESQAYMDLLAFERKLDFTIMRKRLDIQEALKRPMKQKRKLRIFISNTFYPGKEAPNMASSGIDPMVAGGAAPPTNAPHEGAPAPPAAAQVGGPDAGTVPSWELRVEGRLLEDGQGGGAGGKQESSGSKLKRKFSSFFKSLVIELDKDLYGPDNHLVEWHRTPTTTETDGFQVKRPGDKNVRCTILLLLDYQPLQFKLDPRLARLLGIHTQTRPVIIAALWQYVRTHRLQDPHEREFINCDKYLEQIFQCQRMKFAEIPQRLHQLLHPPDPIVINHIISVEGPETKKTACYDIDVEVDDLLKSQMNSFILSTANQQEIQSLDNKIHETVETINQLKTNREFFLSFAKDPQQFINKWLISQTRDLKTMTDVVGNPEEERRSDFYYQRWSQEAVCRYFYGKLQQRRAELEQALGIRNA